MKEKRAKADPLAKEFARRVRERLGDKVKGIILFGSRARGDNDKYSDYDILILVEKVTKDIKDAVDEIGGDMLINTGLLLSTLIVKRKDYRTRISNPVFINIQFDGIKL